MTLSLNEVEAMAKKASRGVDYPWGLAEEAGKAVRWLCVRDIDGCAVLAKLLKLVDEASLSTWRPATHEDVWIAESGTLCPLIAGSAISDRADVLRTKTIRIGNVAEPIFLVPFAAMAARYIKGNVTVACTNTSAVTDGDRLTVRGTFPAFAMDAEVSMGGTIATSNQRQDRAKPIRDVQKVLSDFAHRTYAPATEESRLKGAGADVSDTA